MPGALVVAEVDRRGFPPPQLVQGLIEGWDVFHHACDRRLALEHFDRPAGIAGQERRAGGGLDLDALMARGMTRRRDHPDSGYDLALAVEELEARAGEVEPRGGCVRIAVPALVFQSLHVEGRLRKHGVLSAVVEVQVR